MLDTMKTFRAIRHKMLGSAEVVLTKIARLRSEQSGSDVTTFALTLTKRPEDFKGGTRIDRKSSVKKSVDNTGLAGRSRFNPGVTSAEDVGCGYWAVCECLADWCTGFAAGIRGGTFNENIAFWKINKICSNDVGKKDPDGENCRKNHD